MYFFSAAMAALACLATAMPTDQSLSSDANALAPRAGYSSTSGLLFNIDGTAKYYAGTNAYWIGFLTNNADVDLVMSHLQSSGLKFLRVWGFNDITAATSGVWFQSFITGQSPVINTGANGLQRLDYVVSSAAAHDIKLIINFVNNWSDYGGMAAYTSYYGGSSDNTGWYTSTAIQAQYQTYIKAVVSRYLTSTAIFSWELANEVRCTGCDVSVIYNWAAATSKYIKSLDPNHMVTLGDEGFMNGGGDGSYPYTTGPGVDFVKNLGISTLDFGTFHLYPGSWGETNDWGNAWITNHAAACVAANKPCLLEEYGTSTNHVTVESPWQATALGAKGIAGDSFWQDGDTISTGQTADDGNTIFYGSSDWTGLVTDHISSINALYGSSGPSTVASTKTATSTAKPTSTVKASTTTTAKASTTSTKTSTTTAATGTAAHWAQCAGIGYTGPTTCASPYTCTYSNAYYSQCL